MIASTITWLDPASCEPPHGVTHPEKHYELVREFRQRGWSRAHPVLVGYEIDNRVQLLSGSHRWAAAHDACIKIPVVIKPRSVVFHAWGDLAAWKALMEPTYQPTESV